MTLTYAAIFEKGDLNWSAYVPDLPGCIATGKTRPETEHMIREAIAFHIEGLRAEGLDVPPAISETGVVALSV